MAKKIGPGDPALSIEFFTSGFYTYRSQLFAPFKGIGVNVISFRDPVLDGANFELTDTFQWSRRPGFSVFCPVPLQDSEVVNQFYSSRDLQGNVVAFADTTKRLTTFTSTALNTLLVKTTPSQGYIATVGQRTYFADGAALDLSAWDGTNPPVPWGLAPPNSSPTVTGMGFWLPETSETLGTSILDPNGNIETVTAILNPNGTLYSPANAENVALGGSTVGDWMPDTTLGGYFTTEGYRHIQQAQASSLSSGTIATTFTIDVTVGNVILVEVGASTTNFTPAITSVTDNLGNTYTLQASGTETFHGGGGNNFLQTGWLYSAPITTGGTCTVTVVSTSSQLGVIAHEVFGISSTASQTSTRGGFNGSSMATPIAFSGTQFVISSISLESSLGANAPVGYTQGGSLPFTQLYDAYTGVATASTPTWVPQSSSYIAFAIAASFPITSLATGYTPYLFLYNFNANIPAGSTVVGLLLSLPKQNLGTGAVQDHSVKIVIGGSPTGTDHAQATDWSTFGFAVSNYGSAVDTWGTSITALQVNATGPTGFGFVVSASVTDVTGGSVIPEIGFTAPNNPTLTVFFKQANGLGGPGITGLNEPIWSVTVGGTVNDGGVAWTNYGPIQAWYPATGYITPVVTLDTNGFLELATHVANPIPAWDGGTTYAVGDVVYFGGSYWVAINSSTGVVPSVLYTVTTTGTTQPYWALTTTPLVTGLIAPVWNTTVGGSTTDGSFTWVNEGQGSQLASVGFSYVYAYRTIYGHLTTASPASNNTGAILGPLNASIESFSITGNVVTFTGSNNFIPGNIFQVQGLTSAVGTELNEQSFTVLATPAPITSESFPLTNVAVSSNVLTITAINNLVVGEKVTFSAVGTATFLNGVTVTVLASGLSSSQFEANFTHANYGPTDDIGNVIVIGSYSAMFTHADVGLTLDSGVAVPLIASLSGLGTGSLLCNSTAAITATSVNGNVVTITAANNFQPGLWVTLAGLTGAIFFNNQQVQVTAVDQPLGVENTYFQFIFDTPNYVTTADTGTVTFNGVEIYRTSDGGGTFLFDGAVTNPGANALWNFNDFVPNADLDIELIAPLAHLNDPPPGAPGSTIPTVGSILTYWQGRLWMCVGNYVYFSAGPDCINGIPEESWPPSYRFQFAGPTLGIKQTADGTGLLVYLADRVNQILGGPDTISFYPTDALSNFGISSPNALFRDGSILGQFTTQKQYFELIGDQKQDIGEHIADYLANNFNSAKTYVTMHRDGLDVGVFLSNGVDKILRYGTNITAWSVPYFPAFGAGALASVETTVGIYSLMAASPTGGKTAAVGPFDPTVAASVAPGTPVWVNPTNITVGSPLSYATATFSGASTSQILRASTYSVTVPVTAVVQGVTLALTGKQNISSNFNVTVTPTIAGGTSHTFSFGPSNTTVTFGSAVDLWNIISWSQPGNTGTISFDITATYAGPTPGETGIYAAFDQSTSNSGTGTTMSVGPVTPAAAGEIALVIGQASNGAIGTPSGWQVLDNSSDSGSRIGAYVQIQPTASPFTFSFSLGSSLTWDGLMALFASSATSFTANVTQISITSNVVTVTCLNEFINGTQAICSNLVGATFLNGAVLQISSVSPTQFTAAFVHADYAPTADSGTATDVGIVQSSGLTPGNVGTDSITLPNTVGTGNTVLVIVQGIDSGGFGTGHANITSMTGSDITPSSWTIINSNSASGNHPAANLAYVQNVTGGSKVQITVQDSLVGCRWIVIEVAGGQDIPVPVMSISEAQVIVTYQNPGNYLYARDLNSWGDDGSYGENNGTPYSNTFLTIGNITLTPPGALEMPLQHVVGYFDAVGTLDNGGPSVPNIWILPNELSESTAVPFTRLPEVLPEPPMGQGHVSQTMLALRWPVNMANSEVISQFVHHLQVRIVFEPENAPNTLKAIAFKENQD